MNYRHVYHAGNAADCLKHAILVWVLRALARKDKPFLVLDTHAGTGTYDLECEAARRTGEAARGIIRLIDKPPPALTDYVNLINHLGLYPGSPAIIGALLRPHDRLIACELHPEDYAALRRFAVQHPQIAAHNRDGYEALGAFLPPPERRGATLIDPPYEASDELETLIAGLKLAHRKFPQGVVLAWYPIKHRAPVRALHDALKTSGIKDIIAAELFLREPLDAARLNGSGMILINAPYGFETAAPAMLDALLNRLGDREPGEGTALIRLANE